MKILIIGSNGQLGFSLCNSAPKLIHESDTKLIKTTRKEFDLSNKKECHQFISQIKPDWIINSGAYTAVDKAEENKVQAFKINSKGPEFLTKICTEQGIKMIHISTDFVFDGKSKKPYETYDNLNPINVYGASKALGEKLILRNSSDYDNIFIIRTSWIMGIYGNNFLLKILKLIANKDKLNVVNDQVGCLTNVEHLSKVCWLIIQYVEKEKKIPRILHYSENGCCTWYDIAQEINAYVANQNIFNHKTEINPVSSDFFNLPAKRPKYSLLNCTKTYDVLNFTPPSWEESVSNLLNSLDINYFRNLKNND